MIKTEEMTPCTENDIVYLAQNARGFIDRVYLHWTAGRYDEAYNDYHLCIDGDGKVYITCSSFVDRLSHTWRRNSRSLGVALCCAYGAEANEGYNSNLGKYPPTKKQIETLSKLVQVICDNVGLDITPDTVKTHCEIATIDGYGPYSGDPQTRWDLWYIPDYINGGELVDGGSLIRGKAVWYQNN